MQYLFQLLQEHKVLYWTTISTLGMLLLSLIGLSIDDRLLLGENVWWKPIKFGISIPIFCVTMAWLLSISSFKEKTVKWLDRLLGWSLILEIPLVMVQAARGVPSHYNESTLFDGLVFGMMGCLIFINAIAVIYIIGMAFIRKMNTTKAMQTAIQLAGIAMLVSILAGMQMIEARAHSVGVADGGAGMPITHWSTEGGDWRAIHFLGMHAWQILPLFVYFFTGRNWTNETINRVSWLLGLGYLGGLLFLFYRTAAGFPIL